MLNRLTLTIHGKVPAKSSARMIVKNRRTGKTWVISSPEVKQYERDFARQITGAHRLGLGKKSRLEVGVIVYTDSLRQDIDSFPKVILDELQRNGVIHNDNRIDNLAVLRRVGPVCKAVILIREMREKCKKRKRTTAGKRMCSQSDSGRCCHD